MTNHPLEKKVAHSFRRVKHDVDRLNLTINILSERLRVLEENLTPKESHSMIIPVSSLKTRKTGKKRKRK